MPRRDRAARLSAATGGALSILALSAGCGDAGGPAATSAAAQASTVAAGPVSAAPTGFAVCSPGDIAPVLIGQAQRASGATRMALLQLTNTSDHTCRLSGYATVTLTNAAGETVPVPTSNVPQPAAPAPVDLPPGAIASAGVKWTLCDKATPNCPTGNGLSVMLPETNAAVPADLREFPSAEKSNLTMKSLQIGSIQPSAQGVVNW